MICSRVFDSPFHKTRVSSLIPGVPNLCSLALVLTHPTLRMNHICTTAHGGTIFFHTRHPLFFCCCAHVVKTPSNLQKKVRWRENIWLITLFRPSRFLSKLGDSRLEKDLSSQVKRCHLHCKIHLHFQSSQTPISSMSLSFLIDYIKSLGKIILRFSSHVHFVIPKSRLCSILDSRLNYWSYHLLGFLAETLEVCNFSPNACLDLIVHHLRITNILSYGLSWLLLSTMVSDCLPTSTTI